MWFLEIDQKQEQRYRYKLWGGLQKDTKKESRADRDGLRDAYPKMTHFSLHKWAMLGFT